MARNDDLNNLSEGLRRLQEYEQLMKRIESLAKSIAATLNSVGGDRSGLAGSLQELQGLRTGLQAGGGAAGIGGSGSALSGLGAGLVSSGLLSGLERSRSLAGGGMYGAGASPSAYSYVDAIRGTPPPQSANPFAGSLPVGPSSTIGTPGMGYNSWYFQQQQYMQSQRQIALGAAALAGAHFIGSGLSNYASNTARGDYDPMQGAALWGGGIGAGIGGPLGFLLSPGAPGAGFATGALAGQVVGGAALQSVLAPQVRQRNAELILQSIAARQGGSMASLMGDHSGGIGVEITRDWKGVPRGLPRFFEQRYTDVSGQLDQMQEDISFGGKNLLQKAAIKAGVYTGRDIISLPQISQTYANLASALLSSGEDSAGALTYTRNLASKYYMGAPQMSELAAPVMGSRSRFLQNGTDLLMNFGPERYGAYQDAVGGSDLTPRQLTAYGNIQGQQTRAQIASLQARGAASASLGAVNSAMQEMARLPGGASSLAYAQMASQARGLGLDAFNTAQIGSFDIPNVQLQGRMARAEMMPYGSGNILGMQFENIALQRQRVGSLQSFMNRRRASGELSEQEELMLTSEIEQSRNSIAGSIGRLGQGRENILPALTAGATRFSGRFTSASLATLALAGTGSAIRSYGAANGAHLAEQDAAWSALGGDGFRTPVSRMQGLNSGRDSGEIVSAIKELTRTMERLLSGGGSNRPGETVGMTQGMLSRRNLGGSSLNGAN